MAARMSKPMSQRPRMATPEERAELLVVCMVEAEKVCGELNAPAPVANAAFAYFRGIDSVDEAVAVVMANTNMDMVEAEDWLTLVAWELGDLRDQQMAR